MSSLKDVQEEIKKLVFYGETEKTKSFLWKEQLPSRLDVYRHNTRSNWSDALDHDFPLTRNQFSVADWRALKECYFVKHPPEHWELNTALTPFVKFLEKQKVAAYVKELADYEWFDLQIFISRESVHKGSGVTNPTMAVRVYQHQIFFWVSAGAPAARPPQQKPEVLVFFRDSQNTCHIQEADPLMLLLLDHFRTPGAALETLEPVRRRLLPQNNVPLPKIYSTLLQAELIV
jgi:hypothetical protein